MKNLRALVALSLISVFLAGTAQANTSGVNPNLPAQNSPLSSSVFRGQFAATASDINTIFGMLSLSSNQILGTVNAGNAGPLNLPTCATGALSWTPGSGFGCNSLSGLISPVTQALVFTGAHAISLNATSLPTKQTGTVIQVGNADTIISRIENDAFAAPAFFTAIRSNGTNAGPTTLQSGDEIGGFNGYGYNGSTVVGPKASLRMFASQNWSNGANGTYISLATALNGSTTMSEAIRFENDGGVTVPATVTGGSQGSGTVNASAYYKAGSQVWPSLNPNNILGATTTGNPASLAIPSCSTGTSALTWTTGTGFGCNSISSGSSVSVTAGSANIVISPTPGTGTFTVDMGSGPTVTGAMTAATHNATTGGSAYKINGVVYLGAPDSGLDTLSTAVGPGSLAAFATTSGHNVANGYNALNALTTGTDNTAVGYQAATLITTDSGIVAVGSGALQNMAIGNTTTLGANTAIGFQALKTATTSPENTAVGYQALTANTGGVGQNTAVGYGAGAGITTGSTNTLIGVNAGKSITTGTGSIIIGAGAGAGAALVAPTNVINIGGNTFANSSNSVVGVGISTKPGTGDTAVGHQSLSSTSADGNANSALGQLSCSSVSSGNHNTCVGYGSGFSGTALTTGSGNTFLGYTAQVNSASAANRMALGNGAASLTDNDITLGNASVATIHAQVTSITGISDRREKEQIAPLPLGLDFIMSLKPVSYRYKASDYIEHFGFIAQDTEKALPNPYQSIIGKRDPRNKLALIEIDDDAKGTYHMNYGELTGPIVKALQELKAANDSQAAEISALKKQVSAIRSVKH